MTEREYWTRYHRLQREERFEQGLCVVCGKEKHRDGRQTCQTCADKQNVRTKISAEKVQNDPVLRDKRNAYMREWQKNRYWKKKGAASHENDDA